MDIPSLFMIPSAVSSGKVHSVFPNSTDADFDFNRDSDATRVNSEGLIERVGYYGSEKITNGDFAQSGTPDTSTYTLGWYSNTGGVNISNGSLTLTNGSSDTDIRAYATNGVFSLNILTTNIDYKLEFDIVSNQGSTDFEYYSAAGAFIDAPLTVGRHTINIKNTSNQLFLFRNKTPNSSITLDNVSIKQINGDRARLNYEIEGGLVNTKPSLLLEPQSTNLLAYSEDFSDYTTTNVTITNNQGTSPDGLNNAAKMLMSSGTGTHRIYENISSSLNDNNTFSVFIKEQSEVSHIGLNADTASAIAWFNGANGSIINANGLDAKTQSFGNGWHRISVSYVSDSNDSSDNQFVYFSNRENTSPNVAFVGTESVLMYGFQAEKQSYPTSYIPTNGSTQTRAAETCNGAGTSSILPTQGILFTEVKVQQTGSTNGIIFISNGTTSNFLMLRYAPSHKFQVEATGGVNIIEDSARASGRYKVAVKYSSAGVEMWIDGSKAKETSTATTATGINELGVGSSPYGNIVGCNVFDARIYNTKEMTDSEVDILLTKITS